MKCRRCQAVNARGALTCWACGVRLGRSRRSRMPAYRPEAMRYFQSNSVAIGAHRMWLDGLVLISTVMFGLLLGYFLVDVLPRSGASATARAAGVASAGSRFGQF